MTIRYPQGAIRIMSEEKIEASVEWQTDCLDRIYMSGSINEEEYRLRSNFITKWANEHYEARRKWEDS